MKVFLFFLKRKMSPAVLLLLCLGFLFTAAQAEAQTAGGCYRYETENASATGVIKRVAAGGKAVIWVLTLKTPICFAAGTENEFDEAEKAVSDLQLVLTPEEYEAYKKYVGRRVTVSGSFFHAHTAQHHTKVLLDVSGVETGP